jgi:hypothetical protein
LRGRYGAPKFQALFFAMGGIGAVGMGIWGKKARRQPHKGSQLAVVAFILLVVVADGRTKQGHDASGASFTPRHTCPAILAGTLPSL